MKRYFGPFERKFKTDIWGGSEDNSVSTLNYGAPNQSTVIGRGYVPPNTSSYDTLITRNFNKLKDEGYIIQCPFTRIMTTYENRPGSFTERLVAGTVPTITEHRYTNLNPFFQGYSNELGLSDPQWGLSAAQDEALTRAFSKANSGNADLLIDLSQIRQTISMFASAGRTFCALVKAPGAFVDLVKARERDSKRKVRIPPHGRRVPVVSLSGLWCEGRFGWRPLMSTLEGIQEALIRDGLNQAKRVTYRATEEVKHHETKTRVSTLTWTTGALVFTNEPIVVYTEEASYEGSFRAGVLLEEAQDLWRALGLDARAIPIAIWDIIPLSFIVDRFVNIGNWIRSLRPIPSREFGGGWVTERATITHSLKTEYLPLSRSAGSGSSYRFYTRTAGQAYGAAKIDRIVRSIHERPSCLPVLRHDWLELKDLYNLVDAVMLVVQRAKPPRSML